VKPLYAFAALTLAAGCNPPSSAGVRAATVVRAIDGDTVELATGERIRYLMVDTPELSSDDCFAEEARAFNADLVEGRDVELDYDIEREDRYGRTLAYVTVDGEEINTRLVEAGYACVLHIPPNGEDRVLEFETIERTARTSGTGMWGACEEVACAN
jgi:micrococcal nuclease